MSRKLKSEITARINVDLKQKLLDCYKTKSIYFQVFN